MRSLLPIGVSAFFICCGQQRPCGRAALPSVTRVGQLLPIENEAYSAFRSRTWALSCRMSGLTSETRTRFCP